jgi:hypothetical protein
MPYQNLPDGLFLLKRPSPDKGVEHYGVLDVGNRLGFPEADGSHPVVIHQTPPSVRYDWLQNTGDWHVIGQVIDEEAAAARLKLALSTPEYNLFGHNCEHFARYVTTGVWASTQLQAAGLVAGLALLAVVSRTTSRSFASNQGALNG